MLDAHNSLWLRCRELIFCDLPSNIKYNMGYFRGYGKSYLFLQLHTFFTFYILSVSKKVILLMFNILRVGYLCFKLNKTCHRDIIARLTVP